jgi:arylsulfatase A-like enzyme
MIAAWAKRSEHNRLQSEFPVLPDRLVTQGIGQICDVYATILELAEAKAPETHRVDGTSLLPSLAGQPLPEERTFLMHFPHSHRSSYFTAMRKGRHKLVYHYPVDGSFSVDKSSSQVELFDLATDPFEHENLAETNPKLANELLGAMNEALTDAGAQYPVKGGRPIEPSEP